MNNAKGIVFKFGDNVDTDVIIPARYLNSSDPAELATHCMEDIDKDFIKNVKKGDIIVARKTSAAAPPESMPPSPSRLQVSAVSSQRPSPESSTAMPLTSDCPSLSVPRHPGRFKTAMKSR